MKECPDGSTLGLSGAIAASTAPRGVRVPALTVLGHPDAGRVGDRAPCPELALGRDLAVSRIHPLFAPPRAGSGAPLGDLHLSREPFRLKAILAGGALLERGACRTPIALDGVAVAERREVTAEELLHGVVLELGGRVVLLLHLLTSVPGEPAGGGKSGQREQLGLLGESEAIVHVRSEVRRVADLEVPVLLRGESGTGKELVARALHTAAAGRRNGPFVAVNLGALPPALAAAELFGAVRGAFTGSVESREGYFRRAHGGTLFLDEVGEAPGEVQTLLLRALETGEVHPVGSPRPQRLDVRVIAATDSDLEARIRSGDFRAPLLHRLSGYEIRLPPLAERRDDVGRLLYHFLREELERFGEGHRLADAGPAGRPWLPAALVARLARSAWPGNVRQLRNVARQLAIGSRGLDHLAVGPAVERLLAEAAAAPRSPAGSPAPATGSPPAAPAAMPAVVPAVVPIPRRPGEVGEEELAAALHAHRWDLKATAAALGLSRTSLYARIEESPRVRTAGDLSAEEIARCHRECGGDLDAMVERLEVSARALGRRLRELGLG